MNTVNSVCFYTCFSESYGTFSHEHNPIRLTNTSRLVFQILRAQEAAQAEAEEREDIEIAAETAGIELYQISNAAYQHAAVAEVEESGALMLSFFISLGIGPC